MLDAWAASPDRFREDANAEEALAVGGYAGRVLVELAANAADAARELGVAARLRVRLQGDELLIANTGSPLTSAGVAALASLRASAKRETLDSVGHFGVGFTAVLSWSTAPRVVSSSGGVQFGVDRTRAAIGELVLAELDREVGLRSGQVPVLRLPWPTGADEPPPPDGYATEVRLPLSPAARAEVEQVLAAPGLAEDLFWAVTALTEIDLPDRVVRCGIDAEGRTVITDGQSFQRYRTADRVGDIPDELLADRPVEERLRSGWRITWALPVPDDADQVDELAVALASAAPVDLPTMTVGAPTPTDEPLTLPARLIGTFPVDDTRRRLASGPLLTYLLDRAADTYLDLIAETEPEDRWKLLPASGFPAGPVDAALRQAVLGRVRRTPLLRSAAGDLLTVENACLLPGLAADGAALIGQAVPNLLPPVTAPAAAVLRGLGVGTLSWSQASSALAGIDREPEFWWHVYQAAATADRPPTAEDLADIPIPLTGGRRATGARGCLLPGPELEPELTRRVGEIVPELRIVDPQAAHPLLELLGARPADADALLADPAMVAAIDRIRQELEDDDPDPDELRDLAEVVLDLLSAGGRAGRALAAGTGPDGRPIGASDGPAVIGELVLTDNGGDPWPAGELLVPGAPLAAILAADVDRPFVGSQWSDRYSTEVLVAAGVRSGFGVVRIDDAAGADIDLPDLDEWLELSGSPVTDLTALADLDLVDPDRWAAALALIAGDREARACLAPTADAASYSGWWLSRHALIDGRAPIQWRLPGALDLVGLYDPLPVPMDPLFASWIGVRSSLGATADDDPTGVLDRLADPARQVPAGAVAAITAAVVTALRDADPDLPSGVRTITGEVADAGTAFVLDEPWWAQLVSPSRLVPGGADPALVAGVLDLPLVSAGFRAVVDSGGPVLTGEGRARLDRAAEVLGLDLSTVRIEVADPLRVALNGGAAEPVRWWSDGERYWVDGSAEGAGRAVAWAARTWSARHQAIAVAGQDWVTLAEDGLSSG